jgi:hypothetical protein
LGKIWRITGKNERKQGKILGNQGKNVAKTGKIDVENRENCYPIRWKKPIKEQGVAVCDATKYHSSTKLVS